MKKIVLLFLGMGLLLASLAFTANRSTPEEAKAMVKKAIVFIKESGKDKAFAEFAKKNGRFTDRDLYIFVYDLNGKVLAHGQNPKMVGKDLSELTDADGKFFVKERIEIAKTKGEGWQDYKFPNPVDKKVEKKRAYIEKVDDIIVGCGAYK